MKLKKVKVKSQNEKYIFFEITTETICFWLCRTIKDKRLCFRDKAKKENRFFDTGTLIEADINHSINAVLNDL